MTKHLLDYMMMKLVMEQVLVLEQVLLVQVLQVMG